MKTFLEPEHGALHQKPLLKQFKCDILEFKLGKQNKFGDQEITGQMGECFSVLAGERKESAFLATEELEIRAARMRNKHPGDAAALLEG